MLYKVSNVTPAVRPRTLGFRALAAWVLLVLGAAVGGRAYCPMPSPTPAAGEQQDAHGCCKKGLTGAKPSCCHTDSVTVAVILLKTAAVTLPAGSSWKLPLPVEAAVVYGSVTSTVAAHSPPPRVLRI
jgi:hypothetical protein